MSETLQILVTLPVDPPVWRRLLVPADLPLAELHEALQIAMGWDDCHLHMFVVRKQRYGPSDLGARNERLLSVGDAFARTRHIQYVYDFGSDWDHRLELERRLDAAPRTGLPRCMEGARACPPEDCGGVINYHELLDALETCESDDPDVLELLEWLGDFDADRFDLTEVNRKLAARFPGQAPAVARLGIVAAGRG
ncbi:MAG: plasmid pRiA4b ORF-3 family protein [Candidatus Xenobia bacterium]